VHFLAAGAFASPSDMGRILLASNFGIGLRTAAALDTLRVNKIPGSVRDRELGVGRGYIVKAGQTTMIQVATPYQDAVAQDAAAALQGGQAPAGEDDDAAVLALDAWVAELEERWQEYGQANWVQASANGAGGGSIAGASTQAILSKPAFAMQQFLRKAMLRELDRLRDRGLAAYTGTGTNGEDTEDDQAEALEEGLEAADGADFAGEQNGGERDHRRNGLLTTRWLTMNPDEQVNEDILFRLCRDALVQELRAGGLPQPESMVEYVTSAEDLLMMAEGMLAEEEAEEQAGGEESDEFAVGDAEFAAEIEEMFDDDEEATED
jgi:hypothetical protein